MEICTVADADDARPVEVPDDRAAARQLGGELARELSSGTSQLSVPGLAGDRLTAFVEGLALGSYRFGLQSAPAAAPARIELVGVADTAALEAGLRAATATGWARDLANTPADRKTPAWLAAQAVDVLTPLGVRVAVRDEEWLREAGFGGVLAVGAGSAAPPRLIEASWRPREAMPGAHIVLVGKGITFDTGGVNRKPGDAMRTMHTDMSGGAAVLAALRAIAADRVAVQVTALVPAAENALSGSSFRPGDIVRHYGGRTSEIGNTDAEGRLVLADALAYATARLRPTALLDIATLTGAMKVALGLRVGGLFASADDLAAGLVAAGARTGEQLWRLPLVPEYRSALSSPVADATNAPGNPGAITAALFLRPFTQRRGAADVSWAHLDIAGPARASADDGPISRGATGFGARLLHAWVAGVGGVAALG